MLLKASKAAVISFYETLRVEVGRDIGITIVTPGLVESEMTQGKFMSKDGGLYLDQELRDVSFNGEKSEDFFVGELCFNNVGWYLLGYGERNADYADRQRGERDREECM